MTQGRVRDNFNRAVELSLFFILPSMVALVLIALPLNSVVFERGALVRSDSVSAAYALQIYALGLPAIALQKLCLTLYFAYQNTKTPMRFSLVSVAINAGFALGLSPYFGFLAAAIGATVASWALVGCLWFWMRWQGMADGTVGFADSRANRADYCGKRSNGGGALWGKYRTG